MLFFYQTAFKGTRLHWHFQWAHSRYDCLRSLLKKNQLIYQFASFNEFLRKIWPQPQKEHYPTKIWILFLEKLSAQILRGNSLLSALKSLRKDTYLPQTFIGHSIEYLENGLYIYPLWGNAPLPHHCKKLLQCSETGGYLCDGLKKVISFLNLQMTTRQQIQRCLIYPYCVLGVSLIFISTLTLTLVPKIEDFCYQQNITVNGLTSFLFILSHHFSLILIGIVAIISVLLFLLNTQKISFHQYIIKKFGRSLLYSQFAMNLSALISSGLPLGECLKLTLPIFKEKFSIDQILLNLGNGQTLSEALVQFPEEFCNVLQTAEISGQYISALEHLSNIYYQRYQDTLQQWIKWIEPMSIIFVAGFVFIVLIVLFYPLLQTLENLPLI